MSTATSSKSKRSRSTPRATAKHIAGLERRNGLVVLVRVLAQRPASTPPLAPVSLGCARENNPRWPALTADHR